MGTTIRQLQERVRELEHINRMQAVELWQLREEKRDLEEERRDLETKLEFLLNVDSGPPCVPTAEEERPTSRRISFGPVLFSDGSENREAGDDVDEGETLDEVEEVDAVTIQELRYTGEE